MLLKPVILPPGRARLATTPLPTGSPTWVKTIGIVEVVPFAARAAGGAAHRHDQVDLAADEVGGQRRQPIIMALGPAVFELDVLALDVAGFTQSLMERTAEVWRGREGTELADYRHRLLLRRCWKRDAETQHESSGEESHSMTSSARARIDGGIVRPSASAVLRLITSSNVVGCWTGRSAGLAPLRIFPA